MKALDLRTKTPDELAGLLADLKKEAFNLRFQQASGQLENTARIKTVHRTIARVRTIMAEQKAGKIVAAKPTEKKPAKKTTPTKAVKKPVTKKAASAKTAEPAAKKAPAKKTPVKKAAAKKK